eukprot:TRINITY_DN16719_c2_g1_i5.p2 TRINITY_DN16719_c2_g1~~TRINITY_DN16719_c2_g1_i5.p2  ORF type:complete len:197 (+),score=-20.24 TRINITY_DN16719_c2_g1_i5:251-841(+)
MLKPISTLISIITKKQIYHLKKQINRKQIKNQFLWLLNYVLHREIKHSLNSATLPKYLTQPSQTTIDFIMFVKSINILNVIAQIFGNKMVKIQPFNCSHFNVHIILNRQIFWFVAYLAKFRQRNISQQYYSQKQPINTNTLQSILTFTIIYQLSECTIHLFSSKNNRCLSTPQLCASFLFAQICNICTLDLSTFLY